MNDESAFLKIILENPKDDGPRLVYADWLEERGDERAEFIRLQCEMAQSNDATKDLRRIERVRKLLAAHEQEWLPKWWPQYRNPIKSIWRRGFIEHVELSWERWYGFDVPPSHGTKAPPWTHEKLRAELPLNEVTLTTSPTVSWGAIERWFVDKHQKRLREFHYLVEIRFEANRCEYHDCFSVDDVVRMVNPDGGERYIRRMEQKLLDGFDRRAVEFTLSRKWPGIKFNVPATSPIYGPGLARDAYQAYATIRDIERALEAGLPMSAAELRRRYGLAPPSVEDLIDTTNSSNPGHDSVEAPR